MKKKIGRDYFLFDDEERIGKETVKGTGRRVWILRGKKNIGSVDPLYQEHIWFGWGCNIYGKPYGSYLLIQEKEYEGSTVGEEILELLLEQARVTIRRIQFDTFEMEKMLYIRTLIDKVEETLLEELKQKKDMKILYRVMGCLEDIAQDEAISSFTRIYK